MSENGLSALAEQPPPPAEPSVDAAPLTDPYGWEGRVEAIYQNEDGQPRPSKAQGGSAASDRGVLRGAPLDADDVPLADE